DGDRPVEIVAGQGEGVLADRTHGNAVGNGRRARHGDALPRVEGSTHSRHLLRLHADELRLWPEGLHRHPDAAGEPAAAHRYQHCLQVGHLLAELEADGALAGGEPGIVEGVDEDEPALCFVLPRWSHRRTATVAVN